MTADLDRYYNTTDGGFLVGGLKRVEQLSDFCYGCERLGHTSHHCVEEVIMDEMKPGKLQGR